MATNKSIVVEKYELENPAAGTKVVDRELPEPAEGEVRVKITLRPVRRLEKSNVTNAGL